MSRRTIDKRHVSLLVAQAPSSSASASAQSEHLQPALDSNTHIPKHRRPINKRHVLQQQVQTPPSFTACGPEQN